LAKNNVFLQLPLPRLNVELQQSRVPNYSIHRCSKLSYLIGLRLGKTGLPRCPIEPDCCWEPRNSCGIGLFLRQPDWLRSFTALVWWPIGNRTGMWYISSLAGIQI